MDKILTIAIPTYNRRKWLQRSLEKLLPQVTDEVEVLISDNCSPDDTEDFCLELKKTYNIEYYRQERNLGPDGNFLWCLETGKGKYIQLLADDDFVGDTYVGDIIKYLKNNEFAVGIVNTIPIVNGVESEMTTLAKCENILYKGIDEVSQFIATIGIRFTFSSSLLFSKSALDEMTNKDLYKDSNLLQSHIFIKAAGAGQSAAYLGKICIYEEVDNSSGYNPYKVFIENWHSVLFETGLKAGINKKALVRAYDHCLKNQIRSVVYKERQNHGILGFDTSNKWKYLRSIWKYKQAWISVYPFAILPLSLLKFLLNMRKNQLERQKLKNATSR